MRQLTLNGGSTTFEVISLGARDLRDNKVESLVVVTMHGENFDVLNL